MPDKKTCEIWLAINEDGDYSVADEADGAVEKMNEDWGSVCYRIIKLTVKVTPPVIAEAEVDVADNAGETEKIEAEAE